MRGEYSVENALEVVTWKQSPQLLNRPGDGDGLHGAAITVSSFEDKQRPGFSNDGIHDDAVLRWDPKQVPRG